MAKTKTRSITKKIMILFALSMAASLTLFFILFSTANYILDDIFQNSNFRKDISDPLVSRFQYYVTEKNLKATETFAIRDWAEENKVDYFTIIALGNIRRFFDELLDCTRLE